jgi:hypothetical protein
LHGQVDAFAGTDRDSDVFGNRVGKAGGVCGDFIHALPQRGEFVVAAAVGGRRRDDSGGIVGDGYGRASDGGTGAVVNRANETSIVILAVSIRKRAEEEKEKAKPDYPHESKIVTIQLTFDQNRMNRM